MPSANCSAEPESCIVTLSGRIALGDLARGLIASPSGIPSRFPEIVTLRWRSTRVISDGAAVFSIRTRLRSSTTPPSLVRA